MVSAYWDRSTWTGPRSGTQLQYRGIGGVGVAYKVGHTVLSVEGRYEYAFVDHTLDEAPYTGSEMLVRLLRGQRPADLQCDRGFGHPIHHPLPSSQSFLPMTFAKVISSCSFVVLLFTACTKEPVIETLPLTDFKVHDLVPVRAVEDPEHRWHGTVVQTFHR